MTGWTNSSHLVSRTDPMFSSTDEVEDQTQSMPALSRKEPSDDSNSSSRFVEAMRNPNWRRRPEDRGSCSSTVTEVECKDTRGVEGQDAAEENFDASVSNNFHCSRIPISSSRVVCPPLKPDYLKSLLKNQQQQSVSSIFNNAKADSRHIEETGLYEIVRHVNLPGVRTRGNPVSIFEITPSLGYRSSSEQFGYKHDPFQWNLVQARRMYQDVQPIDENLKPEPRFIGLIEAQKKDKSSQVLQPGETDHERLGSASYASRPGIEKARKAVLEDPAVADVGGCYRVSEVDKHVAELNSSVIWELGNKKTQTEKQLAFQKMLSRLNKGSVPEDRARPAHGDSGHSQISPYHSVKGDRQGITTSRFLRGAKTRDSGVDCSISSSGDHEKEASGDSGISLESKLPSNCLNPRAREFLSYQQHPSFDGVKGSLASKHHTNPPSILLSTKTDTMAEPLIPDSSDSSSLEKSRIPFPTIKNLGPQSVNALLPPGFMGPFPVPAFPALTPISSLAPSPGVVPYPHQGLQFTTPPGFPPSIAPGFPPTAHSLNYPSTASCNPYLCGPTVDNRPLMPVPKPRKPDAATQQAYEAYLEWRKTNEPGYAMECKRRQQRRAQRQMFTPSQPRPCEKPSTTA